MGPELWLRHRLGNTPVANLNTGPQELELPKSEADCLSKEVESLLQKEAISQISVSMNETSEQGFVSQLFAVPKKDGGIRPVVNLTVLNSYVHQVSFKMDGLHLVRDLLRPGDWMTRVDLKDAYFAIPLHRQHRNFLRFRWQGKLYQFNCLPIGMLSAPWIFTKRRGYGESKCYTSAYTRCCSDDTHAHRSHLRAANRTSRPESHVY